MHIDKNFHSNQIQFKARIVNTPCLTQAKEYIQKYYTPADKYYKNLELINKITTAIEKHPSPENIEINQTFIYKQINNARGVISSGKATFIDSEPARSDSIASILNILRRIVDPNNRKSFNKLMGEKYSDSYQTWWTYNIKPIWKDVLKNFREVTDFSGNRDRLFNNIFNHQTGRKVQVKSNIYNGEFMEYSKIKEIEKELSIKEEQKEHKKDNFITLLFKKLKLLL